MKTRSVETQIEINAPVEAVWKALTEAEEITRWFAPEAKSTPGVGGVIWMSWGAPWEGESKIEIWEPNRHLRTSWPFAPPRPQGGESPAAIPLAVDYYLESRGGKTILRLVHSGFGSGVGWDEEYDGVRRGWPFELRSLRHYLERHRGTPRLAAWARKRIRLSSEEAWQKLMSPAGLLERGSLEGLREGDRYSITTATGDELRGRVYMNVPPQDFSGTVENLNDAVFRVGIEPFGDGGQGISIWLAAYGRPVKEMEAFKARWDAQLDKLFPANA